MSETSLDARPSLAADVAFFIALVATAVALGGALAHALDALAHALELPNKIGLPAAEYFTVQQIYRGWNRLAFVLAVEVGAMMAVAAASRRSPRVLWPVLGALGCVALAQALFWTFTYPANVATENWTVIPEHWQAIRARWEYSHAAGALFQLLALCLLIVALLVRQRVRITPPSRRRSGGRP